MYKGNETKPVAVWVFIYHDNGKLTVTQSVIDKEQFSLVQRGMKAVGRWIRDNIKAGKSCPYSPANPAEIGDDLGPTSPNDTISHYSGPDNDGQTDDAAGAEQVG